MTATIDGITAYWYKISSAGWVFGGYLSENLPSNVLVISGIWEVENNRQLMYIFNLNHTYWIILKNSGGGRSGKWAVSGNTLILTEDQQEYEKLTIPEIYRLTISIINNNRIRFLYSNGNRGDLIRSTNLYTY